MKISSYFSRVPRPLMVVLLGAIVCAVLIVAKPEPKAFLQQKLGKLVRFVTVHKEQIPITIEGTATIRAQQEAKMAVQVRGRVVWKDPAMLEGGFFKADAPMFRIEDSDYKLKLEAAEAEVANAEVDLEVIRAKAKVAAQEWELMKNLPERVLLEKGGVNTDKPNPLVLYKPQLKSAKAKLQAAKAKKTQAQLDLERTTVRAPFNCRVRSKEFDLGQYLREGETVATVFGTDVVEAAVSLSFTDMRWLHEVWQDKKKDVLAELVIEDGDKRFGWQGQVTRFLGEVDPRGRMDRVIVEVTDPYNLLREEESRIKPALVVGSFVRVLINAGELNDAVAIPRSALRDGQTVWIVDENDELAVRKVDVLRMTGTAVYLKGGLSEGDKIILTNIPAASEGMKLRPREEGSPRA